MNRRPGFTAALLAAACLSVAAHVALLHAGQPPEPQGGGGTGGGGGSVVVFGSAGGVPGLATSDGAATDLDTVEAEVLDAAVPNPVAEVVPTEAEPAASESLPLTIASTMPLTPGSAPAIDPVDAGHLAAAQADPLAGIPRPESAAVLPGTDVAVPRPPERPVPPEPPARPVATAPAPAPAPVAAATPRPAELRPETAAVAAPTGDALPAGSGGAASADTGGGGTATGGEGGGAGAAEAGTDAGVTASYLQVLNAWLQRHQYYPDIARRRGLQGTAVVRFTFDRTGRVLDVQLTRSSGHAVLDQAALEVLRRASPLPPPPPGVGGPTIQLPLPLNYVLN